VHFQGDYEWKISSNESILGNSYADDSESNRIDDSEPTPD